MLQILDDASRSGKPQSVISVGGQLYESALGSIYFARIIKSPVLDTLLPVILKTIDLNHQNLWAVTINNDRTTCRAIDSKNILFLSQSKREAQEWQRCWCKPEMKRGPTTLSKLCWATESCSRDGATSLVRLNEYLNEGIVGLALSKLQLPHIIKTLDIWIDEATGFILQEYGGSALLKAMADLSLEEFKSIVMQVLVTTAVAQRELSFKHHDLHLENVFINRLKDQTCNGLTLNSKNSWQYNVGGQKIQIKHCGVLAKIGDYGLASITESSVRYERADYSILDGAEVEWGQWTGTLEGQGLYDAVVFLSKFFMEDESSFCPIDHLKWIRKVYSEINSVWKTECSTIGRPLRGREGNAKVEDIFALDCFKEFLTDDDALILY